MTLEEAEEFCEKFKRSLLDAVRNGSAVTFEIKYDTDDLFDSYSYAPSEGARYMGHVFKVWIGRPAIVEEQRRVTLAIKEMK